MGYARPVLPITSHSGRLWQGSEPFRFVGTNCYFLQEEGAREVLGWTGYAGRVDEALRKASALGLSVVRAWAFHDDPANPAALLRAPGDYHEAGLAGVDLALEAAHRHGVRLILSLVNHWEDYGGAPQWLRWHGLDPTQTWRFYTEPRVVDAFAFHVERLLRRWGEHPAVLAWELANEPRGAGLPEAAPMAAWVTRLAGVVRENAAQLVLTGEEGLEDPGMDWSSHTALSDMGSIHLYPEHWGWEPEQWEEAGLRWIQDHAERAAALGKPLILGEFGLPNAVLPLAERRRIYACWVETAMGCEAVSGVCSWSFSTDDRPDDWDAFTWTWRDGTSPEDPVNRHADQHREWAARWGRP